MKIITSLLLFWLSLYSYAQNSQLDNLNKTRQRIESDIKIRQDSLTAVIHQIEIINQSKVMAKLISKGEGMFFPATLNTSGKIRKENNPNSIVLTQVNKSDTVLLTDYMDGYWIVNKGEYFGYINELYLNNTSELQTYKNAVHDRSERMRLQMEKEQMDRESARASKMYEQRKSQLAKRFGKEIAEKIIMGEYWIGMSSEMARESLGRPETINRSVGSWGVHEQWVYYRLYVYIENGKLSSYQTTR